MTVIILIIVYYALADTSDSLGSASANVSEFNSTGDWINSTHRNISGSVELGYEAYNVLPLVSFFKKKGIVILAFIAGLIITIISAVFVKK
jgi:hypothetical protein